MKYVKYVYGMAMMFHNGLLGHESGPLYEFVGADRRIQSSACNGCSLWVQEGSIFYAKIPRDPQNLRAIANKPCRKRRST